MGHVYLAPTLYGDPRIMHAAHITPEAPGLWFMCLCWRGQHRGAQGQPDDFLPAIVVRHHLGRKRKALKALLESGLWSDGATHRGKPGYRVHAQGELWRLSAPAKYRPAIPEALRQAVYARDGYACLECTATEPLSLDHILPFSLGGADTYENLQTLCRSCNSKKGARV